jgi:hypothetical protein
MAVLSRRPVADKLASRGCFRLYPPFGNQFGKVFKGTVVCFFGIRRKKTGRQLPLGKMIRDAVTADALPAARLIRTVACFQILFFFAFHCFTLKIVYSRLVHRLTLTLTDSGE